MPVIYAAAGNCHVYVDASADPEMAKRIAYNAKVQRPGVCNAAETLLVHADVGAGRAARAARATARGGRRAGRRRADALARGRASGDGLGEATEEDWATEYLGMKMAVRVVDSLEEAIDHVNRYGTGHSEAIVTSDDAPPTRFIERVDAACVYVNASTRFTDGGEFGMGAEMGNSTQKLHARRPDRPARADDLQVRRPRHRPDAGVAAPKRRGKRLRLGIFGGAFNPPHVGHLICAQEARWQLELDSVVLMPVGGRLTVR